MLEPTVNFDGAQSTALWDFVGDRLDAFLNAWQGRELPKLADFLPAEPPHARQLLLFELIKADLELGWSSGRRRRKLDDYVAEFPELQRGQGVSAALIYEEYHVRVQCGDKVSPQDCFERFPHRAKELAELLGVPTGELTTSLLHRGKVAEIDVDDHIDDFDLLTLLGRGSFAKVFLARQRSLQRLVALKVSADRGAEPQTMSKLDHPNIVRVYDKRQIPERGIRLLYMQYVPGSTLRDMVLRAANTPFDARNGALILQALDNVLRDRGEEPPGESMLRRQLAEASWAETVCLFGSKIADALHYAHQQKVLHRDIKPANILVAADGNPKLVDFNVSYSRDCEGATAAAYFGGSLAYMSPEQLDACNPDHDRSPAELDHRSDIFSLGVVLWELYSGVRPFADDGLSGDWSTVLKRMSSTRCEPHSKSTLPLTADSVGIGLEKVLAKALQPKAEDRFPDAGVMARDLRLCLRPHARRLIEGARNRSSWAARSPLAALVLAGIGPNIPMSFVNIAYNRTEIIDVLHVDAASFDWAVFYANVFLYPLGGLLVARFARPIAVAARNRNQPGGFDPWVRRLVNLGDGFAVVSLAIWLACGASFSTWLCFALPAPPAWHHLAQFVISHFVCGLIAATVAFVAVHWLCVRYYLPEAVGQISENTARRAARLKTRLWWVLAFAVGAPFFALIALYLAALGEAEQGMPRYFLWLGVLGLINTGMIFAATMTIHADLDALLPVLSNAPEETGALSRR